MVKGSRQGEETIQEYFASTVNLLSSTEAFLTQNTRIYDQYEKRILVLYSILESNRENRIEIEKVRKDVSVIRRELRLQGYNMKLPPLDLKVDGFRNEDASSQGFKRCVLFILEDGDVQYMTGTNNHKEMEKAIKARLSITGPKAVAGVHHLWFNWINRVLILSGAASESLENFDLLIEYASDHKDRLLRKLLKMS